MSRKKDSKAFGLDLKRFEVIALIVLGFLFAYPLLTSALTSSANSSPQAQTIRAEIASLLEKVEQLKQQLKALQQGGTSTSTPDRGKPKRICPLIARALLSGSQGDDVTNLQSFLADEGYLDHKNVSAYFGPLTESALRKWQTVQGIISSGSASSTGWGVAGPRTREFILKRCGGLKEDKPNFPFGTSTLPGMGKKGPNHPVFGVCPALTMPSAASCDGKLRLEWESASGSSGKCLAWKCHEDDDDEDDDEDEDDDDDDDSDDGDDDTATNTATSTSSN